MEYRNKKNTSIRGKQRQRAKCIGAMNILPTLEPIRVGKWNVRTMYEGSGSANNAKEMNDKLKIRELRVTSWNEAG